MAEDGMETGETGLHARRNKIEYIRAVLVIFVKPHQNRFGEE